MIYRYFQPEYVNRFQCDGTRCPNNCCKRDWSIEIDEATYKKYPPEIAAHVKFNPKRKKYFLTLDKQKACPLLTREGLCSVQLKYGGGFLSETCATYPRYIYDFGSFFERSLTLSCPLAAELILFDKKPMRFEFVEVAEKIHAANNFRTINVLVGAGLSERMLEVQIAALSVLQERTLSIDQRLIVLGFFMDKLEEISTGGLNEYALRKLIAAYESKRFLAEQVPRLIQAVRFKPRNFIRLMLKLFNAIYGGVNDKYVRAVADAFDIVPDENERVSVSAVVNNYQRLDAARKNFLADYATFLENYLVNEFLVNCHPWRFKESVTTNYAMFLTTYKIFELILFATTLKGFDDKDDLLKLVAWFEQQTVHSLDNRVCKKIFKQLPGDAFGLMESLLDTKRAVL